LDTAPRFCGIELVKCAFEKAGARWVILHAGPPDDVTADWQHRLVLQAVESRDPLSEAVLRNIGQFIN
jgi:hypothetical protein